MVPGPGKKTPRLAHNQSQMLAGSLLLLLVPSVDAVNQHRSSRRLDQISQRNFSDLMRSDQATSVESKST